MGYYHRKLQQVFKYNILYWVASNSFKYITWDKWPKKKQTGKKFELYQNDLIFAKIFELHQVTKWVNIHKDFMSQNVLLLSNCIH